MPKNTVRRNEEYRISRLPRGTDSPHWKGSQASDYAKRHRARVHFRNIAGIMCQCCEGRVAIDRHHKDGDIENNSPDNIELLCRRCHMMKDGRLRSLARLPRRPPASPKPCSNCGTPYKPLRKGLCDRCYSFHRKHGFKWTPEYKHEKPPAPPVECINCGSIASKEKSCRGYCSKCYEYKRKNHKERPLSFPKAAPRPCLNCQQIAQRTAHGRCMVCYNFRRRTGHDRSSLHIKSALSGQKFNPRHHARMHGG